MKTLKVITIAFLAAAAFSCSDEDRTEFQDDLSTNIEKSFLESDALADGFQIDGASLETGTPPAPSGDLQLLTPSASGNNTSNAQFSFETEQDVDGAFVQLTTRGGETLDRFFDIPAIALNSNATPSQAAQKSLNGQELVTYSFNIDITNIAEVPVGTFCFTFCFYNANGVSNPVVGCAVIVKEGGRKIFKEVQIGLFE